MTSSDKKIRVRVVLQAGLRKYGKGEKEFHVSLPASATLNDLIEKLDMKGEDVWIIGVNGVLAEHSRTLGDDDVVEFFEPIAGG